MPTLLVAGFSILVLLFTFFIAFGMRRASPQSRGRYALLGAGVGTVLALVLVVVVVFGPGI